MKKMILPVFLAAFFSTSTKVYSQVLASDSLALVDIYNADNGVNWPTSFQWNLNAPVSTWFSVVVTGNRVTALQYPGGGGASLKGPIPSSIGNLTGLTDLLMDDSLSGPIPSSMGNLVNLTRLSLQINQLTGSIPASLGNLTKLNTLLLGNNKLTGSIPASLGNLTNIVDFGLQNNQLSDSIPSAIDNFNPSILQSFSIGNNDFTFSGMEGIVNAYGADNLGYGGQAQIPLHLNGNTFSVTAGGTLGNNTYKWEKVSPSFVVEATNIGDSTYTATSNGLYQVVVTNSICTGQLTLTSDTLRISSLPIELLGFSGTMVKNSAMLEWETATEINSSYFTVQRSTDGINFSTAGKVNAAGNSTVEKYYSFTDPTPLSTLWRGIGGEVYYRLQEVDKDGATSLSSIIALKPNATAKGISIYPNPVQSNLTLNFNIDNATNAQIEIVNASGKIMLTKQLNVAAGESAQSINTAGLRSGVYFVRYISANGETEMKFVKE